MEEIEEYRKAGLIGKAQMRLIRVSRDIKHFLKRVLPVLMKNLQKNRDLRKNTDQSFMPHNIKKVKPGRDYFA